MLAKLVAAIVAIVTLSTSAQAAVVTYRFTANFNLVQIVSSGLPSDSYAARGSLLSTISGTIAYESSVAAEPGSSPDNAIYLTPVTILLDQFSTANPSGPTNRLIVLNDPAVYSAYSFLARDSNFVPNPNPFPDAVWFRFNANNGLFSTLEIPAALSLDELIFGTVTLVTRDSATGTTNFANFLMDSLVPVEEVPIPGALLLFMSGLGVLTCACPREKRG